MNLNKVFMIGNAVRDPETRHTSSGSQVTTFTIAVNDPRKKDTPPMFIKVETWQKTAELVQSYVTKGMEVLAEGRLKLEEYETKDGTKRRDPVIVADNIQFGPKKGGSGGEGGEQRTQRSGGKTTTDGSTEDDLPF